MISKHRPNAVLNKPKLKDINKNSEPTRYESITQNIAEVTFLVSSCV